MKRIDSFLLACVMTPLAAALSVGPVAANDLGRPVMLAENSAAQCPPDDPSCHKHPQKPGIRPGEGSGGQAPAARPQKQEAPARQTVPSMDQGPGPQQHLRSQTPGQNGPRPDHNQQPGGRPQNPSSPPPVTSPGGGQAPGMPQHARPEKPGQGGTQPGMPGSKPNKAGQPPATTMPVQPLPSDQTPQAPGNGNNRPQKPNLPPPATTMPVQSLPSDQTPQAPGNGNNRPQKPNLPPPATTMPVQPLPSDQTPQAPGNGNNRPQKPNLPPPATTMPVQPIPSDQTPQAPGNGNNRPQKPNLPPPATTMPVQPLPSDQTPQAPGNGNNRPQKPNLPPPATTMPGEMLPNERPDAGQSDGRLLRQLPQSNPALDAAIRASSDQRAGSIGDVQRERRTIRGADGSNIIVEPGGRVIIQNGDRAIIRNNDNDRLDRGAHRVEENPMPDGGRAVTVYRQDGSRIRTLYDRWGFMLQRVREDPDGRSYVLFENRGPQPGAGFVAPDPVVALPPPVIPIPQDQYRVDLRSAPPAYVVDALTAPPVVPVEPRYTLNQVIYSPDLRARVRSVDLDTITFDTGSWTVDQSQASALDAVARGIQQALSNNANEVFLVEGYTDAVGAVADNLSLSDRRAEAVAGLLTQYYNIPPENLVTQGYGESQLKVQTDGPERANRRVTVRRITPLLENQAQQH